MSAYALRPMSLPMNPRTMQLKAPGDYPLREHATPPPSRSGAIDVYQPYDLIERPSVEYAVDPYNPSYESPAPYMGSVDASPGYLYPQTVQIPTRGVKRALSPSSPTRKTKTASSPTRPKSRGQARPKSSKGNKGVVQQLISAPLSELTQGMTHIPIRNMDAWVNRSTSVRMREVAAKKGKIARPMNSFMLYRSAYAERTKEWCSQNNHQIVSRVSGQSWPLEPRSVRDTYERLAILEREHHKKAHPDYKFAPNKTTPVANAGNGSPVVDSLVGPAMATASPANKKKRAHGDQEESDLDDPDFTVGGYNKAPSQSPRKRTRFSDDTLRPSTPVARPATAAASYNTIYDNESYAPPPMPTYANPFINLPQYSMIQQPEPEQQQQQFYDFLDTDHLGVALPRQAVQEEQKQKQHHQQQQQQQQQQHQQQYSPYSPYQYSSNHSLSQVDPRMLEYETTTRPHTADAALGSTSMGTFDQIPPLFDEEALQESIIPQSSPILPHREPEPEAERDPASPTLSQRSAPTAHSLWPTDGFAAEVSADIEKWLA